MNSTLKNTILFITLSLLSAIGVSQQNQWIRRDSIKGPGKFGCIGFTLNGQGYLGTGYDNNDYKRSIYSYDPETDDWDKMESLGGDNGSGLGRNMATSFTVNGKGYVGTGQGAATYFGDFWEYDPNTDTWQIILGVGMSARRAAVAFSIDTVAYIGTGYDATGLKDDFWKFDPTTNTWTQVANYGGTPRQKAVGLSMKNKGFVGLGDDGILKDDFWMYNPTTNTWSQVQNFPGGARTGACGFVIDANMFVGTGQDFNTYKQDFWQYNFWNNSWSQIQDFGDALGTPRAYATAFAINGIGYVGAGYDGIAKDDFYAYTPLVGINEVNQKLIHSTIFPNPVKDFATITLETDIKASNITVKFYDLNGKTQNLQINNIINRSNVLEISINNINLNTGEYFYSVLNKNKSIATGKILVLK